MTIDLHSGDLITMAQAATLLPKRPSACTLWRWATRGVGGRTLETVIVGKTRYTTVACLEKFARFEGGSDDAPAMRSPRQRERGVAAAEAELEETAGI
jgi:hypothetical protein